MNPTDIKRELNQFPLQGCYGCHYTTWRKVLKLCGKCKKVWYCSQECQKADWPVHKTMCNTSATQGSITQSVLALQIAGRTSGNGTLMLNLEMYAIYLLDLLGDPLNAARWAVEVECAAVSAGSTDPTEFMLCIGEMRKFTSPSLREIMIHSVDKARAAGSITCVFFIFKAGPTCGKIILAERSIGSEQMNVSENMAKGAPGATIPGATESYIMHDLRMEFNDLVRRDTKNRLKLREYIPRGGGMATAFRPDGHIGFSGVVSFRSYGTLRIKADSEAAGL